MHFSNLDHVPNSKLSKTSLLHPQHLPFSSIPIINFFKPRQHFNKNFPYAIPRAAFTSYASGIFAVSDFSLQHGDSFSHDQSVLNVENLGITLEILQKRFLIKSRDRVSKRD